MVKVEESATIKDVVIVTPESFGDQRGRFVETYRRSWFEKGREMVQANRSEKQKNALVGLHYHLHQADYWYVLRGELRVVLYDLRSGSPTEGAHQIIELSGEIDRGVYIPPGVAHGFVTLSDVLLTYLVDSYYNSGDELGIFWGDPELGIDWQIDNPIISNRDKTNPKKQDIPANLIPLYPGRT
jgi:dTDP-4-dehydrorhamnose 3,5-epimerase